ncbi:MAG: YtfJ family protein [Syntrophales bacterium]|jgi:predicted transcriptional regulator
MKKTFWVVLLAALFTASFAMAAELKVGDKAADFQLKDALTDKAYSFYDADTFKGKVILLGYADVGHKDDNDHVSDALKADQEIEKLKTEGKYNGLGIGDQKGSWATPNFLIKKFAAEKQKKTGAIILLDPDYTVLKLYGLKEHRSTYILLDKDHIVRYIYAGKVPSADIPKIKALIKEYSAK